MPSTAKALSPEEKVVSLKLAQALVKAKWSTPTALFWVRVPVASVGPVPDAVWVVSNLSGRATFTSRPFADLRHVPAPDVLELFLALRGYVLVDVHMDAAGTFEVSLTRPGREPAVVSAVTLPEVLARVWLQATQNLM